MTVFVLTLLSVLLALAVLGAVLVRRAIRRLRARLAGYRAGLQDVRARFLPPGPRRDAALLRLRLEAELLATRDMLEKAPDGVVFRADAAALLQELAGTAAAVDRELAAIERFLDAGQQRAALGTLRPQAEQLIGTTYSARQTILRTAAEDRNRRLATLEADVARQEAALDAYRRSERELQL